ncbi:hypothetical protein F5B21DRAFT_516496 [Xylaria acuta]|nr:hypothetical protein F5B21DRAFT_516496 [Xylaria acuta]
MTTTMPRITIIGAGPAGLMLAGILHHNNIPYAIYERDTSAVAHTQGGTVDIHEYSGQQALDAAGLLDDSGKPQTETETEIRSEFIKGRPEIDRPVLKDLLIASLPEAIYWGSKVASITPVANSKQWTLELDDGSHPAPFDLVVGADGAWPRTRALLTEQQPVYSGITALDVWLHGVDEAAPDVPKFVGPGNCFLFDKDRALLFQWNGQGREGNARCYACVKTNTPSPPSPAALLGLEDEGPEVDWADARVREMFVERYFGDWYAEVKRMVLAMAGEPVLRPPYMLPVGLTWESRPGVTLVGDSAHLMTPFAGVGVNVAMMDALELARGIVDCIKTRRADREGLEVMLRQDEEGMFARSGKEAAKTEAAVHLQFREGGAEKMISIMQNAGSQPEDLVFESEMIHFSTPKA